MSSFRAMVKGLLDIPQWGEPHLEPMRSRRGGGWSGSRAPKRFEWRSGLSPRQSGFSENGPLQINLNTDPSGCVFRNNPNQLPLWKRCLFSSGKYWLPREDRLSCHLCLPTAALRVLRACPTFLQPPHRLKQAVKNALSS